METYQTRQSWTPKRNAELISFVEKQTKEGKTILASLNAYATEKNLTLSQVKSAYTRAKEKIEKVNPNDDEKQITNIINYYKRKITQYTQPQEENGIRELYFWLKTRGVDQYKYLIDAIEVFSRKGGDKKSTFGYLVNIVRNWAMFGYGYMPTKEDSMIFDLFEEIIKVKLSVQAKTKLINMISVFGISKLIYLLGKETNNLNISEDISLLYVEKFIKILEEKYAKRE